MNSAGTARSTYHHGDLRNALVRAGVKLAQDGGPESISIRAAAREVGVSPTAAYRHFADVEQMLQAIATTGHLLMSQSMQAELARTRRSADARGTAARRFQAVGRGYVRFARAEPGLFRLAFLREYKPEDPLVSSNGEVMPGPWDLLSETLAGMVRTGQVRAAKLPAASIGAWSAVHGLSTLIVDGLLASVSTEQQDAAVDAVVEMVARGIG